MSSSRHDNLKTSGRYVSRPPRILNRVGRRLLIWTLLLAATLMASAAQAKVKVVTTTQDLAWLASVLGGDRVEVISLCKGHQDPHFLEAKPSYMVQLNKADLLIYVGLDLEVGYLSALVEGSRNPRIAVGRPGNLDLSHLIAPLEVIGQADRSQGDIHPNGNPHYWLDPENFRRMARGISTRLTELDAAGKAVYAANLATFETQLTTRSAD